MRNSNPQNNDIDGAQAPKEPETAEDYLAYAQELLGTEQPAPRKVVKDTKDTKTYQEQVNSLIKEVTVGEDGKFIYPDNTPEHLKYAVATEKKFRDTQVGFTKSQMSLKELEAERAALREQLATAANRVDIPQDKLDELEDLKFSDPDRWFIEKQKLEQTYNNQRQAELDKQMGEVRTRVGAQFELDRRIDLLKQFNEGRDIPVTAEVLDNDIPPRITKKLADGHLTFEGYLSEVDTYLSKNKVVANPTAGNGTNLSQGAGSHKPPAEGSQLEQEALDYTQMTF